MSSDKIENVLILQGGGSLGAFGCGVFKALANNNIKIKIHIVAGTSIGGLNATIIAGSKGTKFNLYCHLCVEHNNKEKAFLGFVV
jgi:predicted acylesterase/phospholipase RssA